MALDKIVDSTKLDNALTATADAIRERGGRATGSGNGAVVTITDALAAPAVALSVDIEPVQDLHGYDAPWPAGGGVNKYPILIGADAFGRNVNATYSNNNGTLVVNCHADRDSGVYSSSVSSLTNLISNFTGQVTYSFDVKASTNVTLSVGYERKGQQVISATTSWQRVSITTTADGGRHTFVVYNRPGGTAITIEIKNFQFELGSSASPYSPYSNLCPISGWDSVNIWNKPTHDTTTDPTVTIQLGQTVYGGTLDVTGGTMTVDRRFITLDGVNQKVTAGYAALGPKRLPIVYLSNQVKAINQTDYDHIRSSYLKTGNFMNAENSIGIGNGGNALPVHIGSIQGTDGTHGYNSDAELVAAANAYLQEHPLQICYKLATPIEIPITPTQIAMLAGTNNVWSNTSNIALKYLIDSELIPFDLENETGFANSIGSIIGVDDIIVIGDYGLCFNNFTVSGNICTSAAGTVSGNTLIAV